ncbi:hypothetical protein [Frigoribacterium faeni]|uniref:Uncharacterized protein n=1 Tax=Frigoribacterium faeni TaxID=145483 RepID=A0A7W3JKX6_9MICO|nr:hypothetical protein [Frigoribacterium faeni]MBA8814594.1 hypothetical protein [Frigoribacterium faeni]GEK83488.1 hypothetical protein FFA01_17970 [Frigoribacterium faeni]
MIVSRSQDLPQNAHSYDDATLQCAESSRSRHRSGRGAAVLALTALVGALGIAPVAEAHGAPPQARHYSSVVYEKTCGPNRTVKAHVESFAHYTEITYWRLPGVTGRRTVAGTIGGHTNKNVNTGYQSARVLVVATSGTVYAATALSCVATGGARTAPAS